MNIFSRLFRGKPKAKPAAPPQECAICTRYLEMLDLACKYGAEQRRAYLNKEFAAHLETHRRVNPYVSPED